MQGTGQLNLCDMLMLDEPLSLCCLVPLAEPCTYCIRAPGKLGQSQRRCTCRTSKETCHHCPLSLEAFCFPRQRKDRAPACLPVGPVSEKAGCNFSSVSLALLDTPQPIRLLLELCHWAKEFLCLGAPLTAALAAAWYWYEWGTHCSLQRYGCRWIW